MRHDLVSNLIDEDGQPLDWKDKERQEEKKDRQTDRKLKLN